MNVIQNNNKYFRTKFGNVGTGHIFSLATGGTPLVKVGSDQYAVVAPSARIGGGSVPLPTGIVPYYAPAVSGISSTTEVFDPKSNPSQPGSEAFPQGASVIEIDPPFFKGLSSYLLSAVFNSNNTVSLSWTYPNLNLIPHPEFGSVYIRRIILQRSTSTRKTPFGPLGDGPVNANINTVNYTDIPSDPAWQTLIDDAPDYQIVGLPPYPNPPITNSYTDTPPITGSSHIFHYRVIVLTALQNGAGGIRLELDWNVITIITPYTFNVNSSGLLTWDSPSASELDSLSRLFGNSLAVTRSATQFATTLGSFTMPPGDGVTRSSDVAVNTNSFITVGQLNGYVMAGVGVVRLERGGAVNTIRVVNPGYSTNVSPGSNVTSEKAITSTTEVSWVFDLAAPPTNYTLQKSIDGVTYATAATLSPGFFQPFKDEDPPNPTIYYKLIANMPSGSEGIPFGYVLNYAPQSIS